MKRTRRTIRRHKRKQWLLLPITILLISACVAIPMKANKHEHSDIITHEIPQLTSSNYIQDSFQAQEIPEPESLYIEMTMFTTTCVNLRESATTDSQSLVILPASQLVTAQVIEGEEWYKVSYEDIQGYICADYLKEYNPEIHLEIGLDYVHQDLVREMIELFQLDVDEYFFYGMMYTENRFQNEPESSAGAQGILQIIPSTWAFLYEDFKQSYPEYSYLVIDNPTDKTSNIILGIYYISYIQQCYGFNSAAENAHAILTSYNRGMSNAQGYYRNHGTYETEYSQEIMRAADYIRVNKTWKEGL